MSGGTRSVAPAVLAVLQLTLAANDAGGGGFF